jgi:ADP-ribose pyrophosphatase YjhB (NUDIX family)
MGNTPVVQKVVAYVIHTGRLLVFEHVDEPEAGVQVPAGTVRPGEDLRAAVLRETFEETGLEHVRIVRYLGVRSHDARVSHGQLHERHFFQVGCTATTPESWIHHELHDGLQPPTAFRFAWVALNDHMLNLVAEFGALLDEVIENA